MKTKMKKSNITVPIVLAVALILVLSATFALFTETVNGTRRFTLSNFTSDVVVAFGDTAASPDGTVGEAKYYAVSLKPSDSNYIGNLRVSVKYNGKGVGLVRVRIAEEWYSTDGVNTTVLPYRIEIPYTISNPYVTSGETADSGNQSKWYDNRANDYCYYYATPISRTSEQTIQWITGIDASKIDFGAIDVNSTNVRVIIEADVVQVNRYPQYWGINSLPWTNASSATEVAA